MTKARSTRQPRTPKVVPTLAETEPAEVPDPYAGLDDAIADAVPVPTWVSFLSPSQAAAAWRRYSTPLRVRGAFGTGRSVVAAHRAVHLARHGASRVALIAPGAAQVVDLKERIAVLADPHVAARIVIDQPDGLARSVLAELGTEVHDEPATVDAVWAAAELTIGMMATEPGLTDSIFRDEVSSVIRGRGLVDPTEYDSLREDMSPALRHQVWALHEAYGKEMLRRNIPDGNDVVRMARAALQVGVSSGFSAVIVDDANDLTLSELRFARELVRDEPQAVTLLDDGLPGLHGVLPSLSEAGFAAYAQVDLDHSFRLTGPVWASVVDLLQPDQGLDLLGEVDRPHLSSGLRDGPAVDYQRSALPRLRREKLVTHLADLIRDGASAGAIAILVLENHPEPDLLADLTQAGVAIRDLNEPDQDLVALGSVRDARGLEFDHVLIADVRHRDMVAGTQLDWDKRLRRRLIGMAVARARISVWIGGA